MGEISVKSNIVTSRVHFTTPVVSIPIEDGYKLTFECDCPWPKDLISETAINTYYDSNFRGAISTQRESSDYKCGSCGKHLRMAEIAV